MTETSAYLVAIAATFIVNMPFGDWRAGARKFSPQWFLAVHAAVPMVIALRYLLGLPFRWSVFPLFVVAYFGGQFVGSRLRARRDSQPRRP
jgi:phosphatidylserine synthase